MEPNRCWQSWEELEVILSRTKFPIWLKFVMSEVFLLLKVIAWTAHQMSRCDAKVLHHFCVFWLASLPACLLPWIVWFVCLWSNIELSYYLVLSCIIFVLSCIFKFGFQWKEQARVMSKASFNGDFRSRPQQNFGGASRNVNIVLFQSTWVLICQPNSLVVPINWQFGFKVPICEQCKTVWAICQHLCFDC